MNSFLPILWQSTIELSLLLLIILLARFIIRKTTKNYNAYLLWLSIPLGLLIAKLVAQIEFTEPPVQAVNYLVGSYIVKPATSFDGWLYAGYLWAIIAELLLLRLLWQHIALRRSLALITVDKDFSVESKYSIIAIDKEGFSPAVYGFFKPKIYFPVQLEKELSIEQIKLIIQHEEHHIKQKHLWLNLLWDVVVCFMWFNPLVYISRQNFRHDQELFCDYLVLNKSTKQDHKSYGHALLSTVSATHSVSLLCSWKMFNQLEERIMNIKKPTSFSSKLSLLVGGLAIISCTSLYAINKAQYSASESFHLSDDNNDRRIEWNHNGKSFVNHNGDLFVIDKNGKRRVMTNSERRDFERAVEKSERERQVSDEHMRKAEIDIERAEREMELAEREIDRAHIEIETAQEALSDATADINHAHRTGELSDKEHKEAKKELKRDRRELMRDRENIKVDTQRAKEDMKRARREMRRAREEMRNRGVRVSPPRPPAPISKFRTPRPDAPKVSAYPRVRREEMHRVPPIPAPEVKAPVKPVAPIDINTVAPIKTFPPKYPASAIKSNTSGQVSFKFDVTADGKPHNIQIVDSVPEKIFDEAALEAIKQWEFRASEDGLKDVRYQLKFALE